MDTPGMLRWADAIKTYEGWVPGDRAYRNNSPGDFRWPIGTTYLQTLGATGRDPQGFAIFPTQQAGINALLQFLRDARSNLLIRYRQYARELGRPGNMCTLGDFFQVYAPTSDANIPSRYAQWVAQFIGNGVVVGTPINQI